ncbi:MAG: bifunctional hydroxymethylpyrimidine kinase/phosphomethylpyrimidine kinase [Raoultibacter sp.]
MIIDTTAMVPVLSIAGSDPSGGAGIQADIKTITAHRCYAETVITALTAQNTLGVYGVENISREFIAMQIDAVFDDIRPEAVKIGMVSSVPIIETIVERLRFWGARNIVLDPVMMSTSGGKLISDEAIDALKAMLIPLADVITPNLAEAEVLCGYALRTEEEMERAASQLHEISGNAVLIKGGHLSEKADDVLIDKAGTIQWFAEEHIVTNNTHGTGCTLSSAIACDLAMGLDMPAAVYRAKSYVTGALRDGLELGRGSGPLNHMWEYAD